MGIEWIILIVVLVALMILGAIRWLFYPSREIDVYQDQRKNMSAGTHRAFGEMDMADLNRMSEDDYIKRLNLLRRMGYVILQRPREGVELDENGIYRRKDADPSE